MLSNYNKPLKFPHKKRPMTSFFLEKDKVKSLATLLKAVKDLYSTYPKESVKRARLKDFSVSMWNDLQNEFYMSADICDNTIWKWSDRLETFDEYGYLAEPEPCELTEWSQLLKGWFNQEWTFQVLALIKDFNLDNQNPTYVTAFQNDFKKVKNQYEFCGALTKWNDLILWSPDKITMLDGTFIQPVNEHYENEFIGEVEEELHDASYALDGADEEEVACA